MNRTVTKGLKYSTVEIDDFTEKLEQYMPSRYAIIVKSMLKLESIYSQPDIIDLVPLYVSKIVTHEMLETMGTEKAEHYIRYNMCNDFALELMKRNCVSIEKYPHQLTGEFKYTGNLLVGINREKFNEFDGKEGSEIPNE